jgi:alanyl-tRNA synthetase
MQSLVAESVDGIDVVVRRIDLPQKELSAIAASVAEKGGVALIAGAGDMARVVLASGNPKVNAGEIIGQICELLGGKGGGKPTLAQGGGPNVDQIDLALNVGRERILASLHG